MLKELHMGYLFLSLQQVDEVENVMIILILWGTGDQWNLRTLKLTQFVSGIAGTQMQVVRGHCFVFCHCSLYTVP